MNAHNQALIVQYKYRTELNLLDPRALRALYESWHIFRDRQSLQTCELSFIETTFASHCFLSQVD